MLMHWENNYNVAYAVNENVDGTVFVHHNKNSAKRKIDR